MTMKIKARETTDVQFVILSILFARSLFDIMQLIPKKIVHFTNTIVFPN